MDNLKAMIAGFSLMRYTQNWELESGPHSNFRMPFDRDDWSESFRATPINPSTSLLFFFRPNKTKAG